MVALKIEQACIDAKEKLEKLGIEDEIQGKLEWVLGSYANDGNPEGLYEVGALALEALKEFKKSKPRSVTKKLIEDLEKGLQEQSA